MVQRLSQGLTVWRLHVVAVGITDDAEIFDKAYANEIVKDHEKDAAEFRKAAINGKDLSLRNLPSKTLPTLQSHLQQEREMQRTVQASTEN
jgi:predicted outer membrane protein